MTGDVGRLKTDARTELLLRVAAERGIDVEPMPATVAPLLAPLASAVAEIVDRLSEPQELRWVAAALAALAHQTQPDALAAEAPGDVAAVDFEGEQDVDPFQGDRAVDVEEVHSQHGRRLGMQEPSPGRVGRSQWCGRYPP